MEQHSLQQKKVRSLSSFDSRNVEDVCCKLNFFTQCSFWQLFLGSPLPSSLLLLLISFCTRKNCKFRAKISDASSILQVPEDSWILQCWFYLIAIEFHGEIPKPLAEHYHYSILVKSRQSHRNSCQKKFKAPIFYRHFENISDGRAGNALGVPASPSNKGQCMLVLTVKRGWFVHF